MYINALFQVTPCSVIEGASISEDRAATTFSLEERRWRRKDFFRNIYQPTRCHIPECSFMYPTRR
jgi:hypothetical protein